MQYSLSRSHSVQKTISDGIRDIYRNWPLTCYAAVTDKMAELRNAPNEVTGDVSFEEVRWADYQEPNKQTCMARFTAACQAKHMQFQVIIKPAGPVAYVLKLGAYCHVANVRLACCCMSHCCPTATWERNKGVWQVLHGDAVNMCTVDMSLLHARAIHSEAASFSPVLTCKLCTLCTRLCHCGPKC